MQSQIDVLSTIDALDWVVFWGIAFVTIASVALGHRRAQKQLAGQTQASFLDHMLLGRALTLPMFVATIVAAWYGGIFGVTEISFSHGIYNFVTQGVFWYGAYIFFALFLAKSINESHAVTLPELVGMMFGPRAGKVAAVFNFFNILPVAYALSMGLFIDTLFGVGLPTAILIGTAIVVAYTMLGGFRAVVFSDIIQFGVMCSSVAAVLLFAVMTFGGIDFLRANLPETHFSPTGGQSLGTMFVWGLIAAATLVDPSFYQRCLAAKSPRVARNGIFVATVIWCLFDI